jgi:hypothetical protein
VLGAELLQAKNKRRLKVLDDIDVCLASALLVLMNDAGVGQQMLALIRETYGPTASMTDRKSLDDVTSTLTHRFDRFLSMVSRRSFAA